MKRNNRNEKKFGVGGASLLSGFLLALPLVLFLAGCSGDSGKPPTAAADVENDGESGEIFIVDRTGKRWEVSHAKEKYGLQPENFQFGLGPHAIKPINNPVMIGPGDSGYPGDREQFLVLGTNIGGDARAYRIGKMSRHEVANERFGEAHVAVAY